MTSFYDALLLAFAIVSVGQEAITSMILDSSTSGGDFLKGNVAPN
jgi:hypothetical protein